MIIENLYNQKYSYTDETKELFDAMLAGKTIKSITCMSGFINKDKPENDFTLTNVKAIGYWVGMSSSEIYGSNDLVDIEPQMVGDKERDCFYILWVRSFEL